MSDYLAYQEKYRDVPRESDRVLIELVSKRTPKNGRVLDVGCSTGNLLRHLQEARTDLSLYGIDLDPDAVDAARQSGFTADIGDITFWVSVGPVEDAVILNAVLYCLTDKQALAALSNIHKILKPGGHLFVWDLLHPWEQRLTILEETVRYGTPTYHIRPYSLLCRLAGEAGFKNVEFHPCKPPRLDKPDDPHDLTSWTYPFGWKKGAIAFRGGVAQPWCHAVLQK